MQIRSSHVIYLPLGSFLFTALLYRTPEAEADVATSSHVLKLASARRLTPFGVPLRV